MGPFLKELLKDELNDGCIQDIVQFVVGVVRKFEVVTDETMEVNEDELYVGSKRKLTFKNDKISDCKRRKLSSL